MTMPCGLNHSREKESFIIRLKYKFGSNIKSKLFSEKNTD